MRMPAENGQLYKVTISRPKGTITIYYGSPYLMTTSSRKWGQDDTASMGSRRRSMAGNCEMIRGM